MSITKTSVFKKKEFTRRFVEACGTSKAAEIAALLDISYQAAKNYLSGKLPNTRMLVVISAKTSCSIDWLLLGRGKKFLNERSPSDAPLPIGALRALIRDECRRTVDELLAEKALETAEEKVYVLKATDILEEKTPSESSVLPLKNS